MKILKQIWTLMASMVLITACTQDIPTVSLGIDDIYYLERMKSYKLTPAFTGQEYRWTMKTASGKDSLVSTESTYIFLQKDEGTYDMTFEIIDPVTPYKHDFRFIVIHEEIEYSPYIVPPRTGTIYQHHAGIQSRRHGSRYVQKSGRIYFRN